MWPSSGKSDSGVPRGSSDTSLPGSMTTRATPSLSARPTTSPAAARVRRAERFDATFFLDLPGASQKQAIWQLYLDQFGLDPEQRRPRDRTGPARRSRRAAGWRPCSICR